MDLLRCHLVTIAFAQRPDPTRNHWEEHTLVLTSGEEESLTDLVGKAVKFIAKHWPTKLTSADGHTLQQQQVWTDSFGQIRFVFTFWTTFIGTC